LREQEKAERKRGRGKKGKLGNFVLSETKRDTAKYKKRETITVLTYRSARH